MIHCQRQSISYHLKPTLQICRVRQIDLRKWQKSRKLNFIPSFGRIARTTARQRYKFFNPKMTIPEIRYGRQIHGISAAFLPWQLDGTIDWDSYQLILEDTWGCGLTPAINMDTGFTNLLTLNERESVLAFVASQSQGRPFVAGAFGEDASGPWVESYQRQCVQIQTAGGVPILFQTSAMAVMDRHTLVKAYRDIASCCAEVYAFELGKMFAPFGTIYDIETFTELLNIPTLTGIKHSSLSRQLEWDRLRVRDSVRPDFKIFTGNDLAVDMVQWGSDYLLGLSAFYPRAFAKRDAYWSQCDSRFYELNDVLQYLGFLAFRAPVPAYKHTCAMVLERRGVIRNAIVHPMAATRPAHDIELLVPIIERLDQLTQ